ncbi:MAG: LPXTG cell wall anchor domain-containing protein [Lachnospiraceae bacterium]
MFRVQTNNKVNNPKTGDNIVTYIVIGVVAILGIIICAVMYLKKKKDNK